MKIMLLLWKNKLLKKSVALQKRDTDTKKQEEELKMEKGTFVKIIAGKQSNT